MFHRIVECMFARGARLLSTNFRESHLLKNLIDDVILRPVNHDLEIIFQSTLNTIQLRR